MNKYENSYIYKLCCKDTDIKEIYIGSTKSFASRKAEHKYCCKTEKSKSYQFIRDNGNFENWSMILINEVNCKNKLELLKIEREYIEELKPQLNIEIPLRTINERQKLEKYKIKRMDRIQQKVICECGMEIQKGSLLIHTKSKKHLLTIKKKL